MFCWLFYILATGLGEDKHKNKTYTKAWNFNKLLKRDLGYNKRQL